MFTEIYNWIKSEDPRKLDNVVELYNRMKGNEAAGIAALAAIDVESGEPPASQNPVYLGFYQLFREKTAILVDAEVIVGESDEN